jgi:hypothetical protein
MYDREAIRAPSVARYALGVAVACERRRDSSFLEESRKSRDCQKRPINRTRVNQVKGDLGITRNFQPSCIGDVKGRRGISTSRLDWFEIMTVCSHGRPAQILIMKNPISFGTLPPSTLPKKRINRTRTDTRVCEKI